MAENSLGGLGRQWFEDIVRFVTTWFRTGLTEGYETLTPLVFGTPTPTTKGTLVFGTPVNAPWPMLHDVLVGGEVTLLALLVLAVSVQGRHTVRIFNFGSAYEARRTTRTAWTGAFLIVTWYWIATVTLLLVEGLTLALLPDFQTLIGVMQQFLTVALVNPILALFMMGIGGIGMWLLRALLFVREILVLVYVYAMPFGIALAFGNLPVISRIARGLCIRFIPLAVLPIPIAILFAGYGFLFGNGTPVFGSFASAFPKLLIAASLPVLAVWVAWRTFGYATPTIARVTGGVGRTALTVGAIAGASYLGGPALAATAGREGTRTALRTAAAKQVASRSSNGETTTDGAGPRDAHGQAGVPAYRRTENDPGYY
jgi:hypothetical protein